MLMLKREADATLPSNEGTSYTLPIMFLTSVHLHRVVGSYFPANHETTSEGVQHWRADLEHSERPNKIT